MQPTVSRQLSQVETHGARQVGAASTASLQATAISLYSIAPVSSRHGTAHVRGQRFVHGSSGFEKCPGQLRFPRERRVTFIGVHENARRQLGGVGEMYEVQAVVRGEPDVGDDPVVRVREESEPRGLEVGRAIDEGQFPCGQAQPFAKIRIRFNEEYAVRHVWAELHGATGVPAARCPERLRETR